MLELERSISDDVQSMLFEFLHQLGGCSLEDKTRRILVRMFSNDVAVHFSWEGMKGKRALKDLALIKIMRHRFEKMEKNIVELKIGVRQALEYLQQLTKNTESPKINFADNKFSEFAARFPLQTLDDMLELESSISDDVQSMLVSQIFINQTRSLQLWADWRMKKDVRKRKALEDNYEMKIRLNALRRNKLLPPEIQEIATADFMAKLPNDVKMNKIIPRCAITSRPRGNVLRWRLSRIMFRHLADYNKLAGVQRAMW